MHLPSGTVAYGHMAGSSHLHHAFNRLDSGTLAVPMYPAIIRANDTLDGLGLRSGSRIIASTSYLVALLASDYLRE